MNDIPVRLILTPGDPAGIGPDLCLAIAMENWPAAIAIVTDPGVLSARGQMLGTDIDIVVLDSARQSAPHKAGQLQVLPVRFADKVIAGKPSSINGPAILESLRIAASACLHSEADAMVTGPVSKAVLSQSGTAFSGHTEFLAAASGNALPVMLLCSGSLRVALATTHLPLAAVPAAITADRLESVLLVLHDDLWRRFRLDNPQILVCGLNPHAGESGHLGREEIEIIEPVLQKLRDQGLGVTGPLPADTAFLPERLENADAVLAMYHDQGLPVLKYAGFRDAVNVTLGLPFVRTSVDHGTAFDLAGSGRADPGSLRAAINLAIELGVTQRD
ncbi:MAG: 4-hydroxythreonine-4-phosphate dehydrogenase PdxA [Gammaproteobacteria bacterium]|nr:4-hydroxythreonine-4-phosphate dehydrogenase PdxA [Gammaproteobacteria bacterium]